MGFTAPEKAAHPDRLLLFTPETVEIGFQNSLQSPRVFAIADEGLEFEAKCPDLAFVIADFGNLGHTVV